MRERQGLVRRAEAPEMESAARKAFAGRIAAGREAYERTRHLPRIVGVGPTEIGDDSPAGRAAILRRIARALRAERRRGRAGHWSYDLNRHIALSQAYAAEREAARERPKLGK